MWRPVSVSGLSPRTRGRLNMTKAPAIPTGSIPANAGETWRPEKGGVHGRVYPRERGGDERIGLNWRDNPGLSPRTRGRLATWPPRHVTTGSIPANAGETRRTRWPAERHRVYPRERGGDRAAPRQPVPERGLSPRTRGRPMSAAICASFNRSIPANAGETKSLTVVHRCTTVYPRERGGDCSTTTSPPNPRGLSPRTRGRPT